jgi:hypothetical protein
MHTSLLWYPKIQVIKFNIDHRTYSESSETVKHSNLKLTFTVYFNRAIVSALRS